MSVANPPLILLMGPTAAGKTDLALQLVAELPLEIISVDSALVYRGMDIGTGKPSQAVLRSVPHHLVDILDPSERYSAGQFVRDVQVAIKEIRARNKVPLLVGGTMLYFKALTQGLANLPEANVEVRAGISAQAKVEGWPALHAKLALVDAAAAKKILLNDGQRIQRALEVFQLTSQPISVLQTQLIRHTLNDRVLQLAWSPSNREELYVRIEARFKEMLKEGFVDEVQQLKARGDLVAELPSMRSVGYRQIWDYLANETSLDEAVHRGVTATRHLARRQLIWLRAMHEVVWFDSLDSHACDLIKQQVAAQL